jgi:hypothetical protein
MYYKILCSREQEMAGAGLGYAEIFGYEPRYFHIRHQAEAYAHALNHSPSGSDYLNGTYSVQERNDGDDADDYHCAKQLA